MNPEWTDIFTLSDGLLVDLLDDLAERVEERLYRCPCTGPCTMLDTCDTVDHPAR